MIKALKGTDMDNFAEEYRKLMEGDGVIRFIENYIRILQSNPDGGAGNAGRLVLNEGQKDAIRELCRNKGK